MPELFKQRPEHQPSELDWDRIPELAVDGSAITDHLVVVGKGHQSKKLRCPQSSRPCTTIRILDILPMERSDPGSGLSLQG